MGSLALATAVGGLGKGMQSNVEHSRNVRREDLDRDHDLQLEAQRAKNNRSLQQDAQKYSTEAADIQQKRDVGMAEVRAGRDVSLATNLREHQFGLQMNNQELEVWKTNADNESDEWQAAYRSYMTSRSGAAGTSRTVGKWKVDFDKSFDMELGKEVVTMTASHDNLPFALEQVGNRMISANLPEKEREEALAVPKEGQGLLDKAELRLLSALSKGEDISDWFLRTYKYLPRSFYQAQFETSDDSMDREFAISFQRDRGRPEMPYGGNMPRSTPDRTAEIPVTKTKALSEAAMPSPLPAAPSNAPSGAPTEVVLEPTAPSNEPPIPSPAPTATDAIPTAEELVAASKKPERGKQQYGVLSRAIAGGVRDKPWITNPVARYKEGLELTLEQAQEVVEFLRKQAGQ